MRFHYYMIKGIRKNTHRTDDFLSAVYNQIKAMSEILWDVYCNHNHLLYGIWSQDSHYKETDFVGGWSLPDCGSKTLTLELR